MLGKRLAVRVRAGFLADRLLGVLALAAAAGAVFVDTGQAVGHYSLLWLGGLVLGVGLTLEAAHLQAVFRRAPLVLLAVLLPWGVLVACGVVLARVLPGPASEGLLTIASAPSEVSAVLLTAVALGDAALATAAVSLSLLLAPLVIPFVFHLAGIPTIVPAGDLLVELGLGVAAPLAIGLGIRWLGRGPRWAARCDYGADLGTLALALLLFGAGAAARAAVSGSALAATDYAIAAAGLLVALGLPFAVGAGVARVLRLAGPRRVAVVFSAGMREFGVATTVAQLAVPLGVPVPAIYGIVLMLVASLLAQRLQGDRAAL